MTTANEKLGRICDLAVQPTSNRKSSPELPRLSIEAERSPMIWPQGPATRRLDAEARLRLPTGNGSAARLGWRQGGLDAVIVNGWLVLTQPPELIGARSGRCRAQAQLMISSSGIERVCLRPAHIFQLAAEPGTHLLIAPSPGHRALIVVNPDQLARFAPPHVQQLLTTRSVDQP